MADILLSAFTPNTNLADPATAELTTNDTYQPIPTGNVPLEEVVLKIVVDTAATTTTIQAGDNPPALAGGQGDLVFTSLATGTHWVGPFTSARFSQSDGTMNIKAATAANVNVVAIHMPRTA